MQLYLYRWVLLGALAVVVITGLFLYKPAATLTAEFGGVSLRLEYATSSSAQERGLGGRVSIPSDYGMLFIFPQDGVYGFWMKDMLVPIDIFWLDDKGQVITINQDVATSTYPNVFYPPAPVHSVLETAAGFARANSIATGTSLLLKN